MQRKLMLRLYAPLILPLLLIVVSHRHSYADDYGKGWCDALQLAVDISHRNRDHWRALVDLPSKTSKEVLDDAYCESEATVVKKTLCLAGVTVDLYVVLPDIIPTAGTKLLNGDVIHCPAGERELSTTPKE